MPIARDTLRYIRTFIKDRNVASVMPSSPFLVKRVLQRMDFGTERRVVVEYGPGLGVFSRAIVEQMGADDRIILVEANLDFVEQLQPLARDGRVDVVHDRAENVERILEAAGEPAADYVLSGIPFSFFDDATRRDLILTTRGVLRPGGKFLVYQHYNHMEKPLRRHFGRVETDFELLNIPPIHIQSAIKTRTNGRAPSDA